MIASRINWISKAKGLAALGIVAVHAGIETLGLNDLTGIGEWIYKLAASGMYCVQLFFVISAYLTFRSLDKKNEVKFTLKEYFKYLAKKIIRLAPILYIAVIWQLSIHFFSIKKIPNIDDHIWKDAFFAITFLNGFSYNHINPWGNWYLGILFQFFILAPLLKKVINTNKKSVIFFVLSTFFSKGISVCLAKAGFTTDGFFYYWFPRQLPLLALGIVFYNFQKIYDDKNIFSHEQKKNDIQFLVLAIATLFLLSTIAFSPMEKHVQTGFLLMIFSYALFSGKTKFFVPLAILGENSYGVYLYHICILFMLQEKIKSFAQNHSPIITFFIIYLFLVASSLLLSILTNKVIEFCQQKVRMKLWNTTA